MEETEDLSDHQLELVTRSPLDWEDAVGVRWVRLSEKSRERVVDALCEEFRGSYRQIGDRAYEYRLAVARSLGKLRHRHAVKTLLLALTDSRNRDSNEAEKALKKIPAWQDTRGAAEARKKLLALLKEPGRDKAAQKGNCVYALGVLANPDDVKVLVQQLKKGQRWNRPLAAEALVNIGTREAWEALNAAVDSERDGEVHGSICEAIERFRGGRIRPVFRSQ